jgi:hypothetical protein
VRWSSGCSTSITSLPWLELWEWIVEVAGEEGVEWLSDPISLSRPNWPLEVEAGEAHSASFSGSVCSGIVNTRYENLMSIFKLVRGIYIKEGLNL